jgi:hypothetical protein
MPIAWVASTCTGNPNPCHHTRRGVVVAVAAKQGNPALGQKLHCGGVQPGTSLRRVPRPVVVAPWPVTDPDEQQVTRPDGNVLCRLRSDQRLARHRFPGSSHRRPSRRGMSSNTPRPTIPSRATSRANPAAPETPTLSVGTPLYKVP